MTSTTWPWCCSATTTPVDPVAYREKLDAIVEELAGVPRIVFLTNYEFEPRAATG